MNPSFPWESRALFPTSSLPQHQDDYIWSRSVDTFKSPLPELLPLFQKGAESWRKPFQRTLDSWLRPDWLLFLGLHMWPPTCEGKEDEPRGQDLVAFRTWSNSWLNRRHLQFSSSCYVLIMAAHLGFWLPLTLWVYPSVTVLPPVLLGADTLGMLGTIWPLISSALQTCVTTHNHRLGCSVGRSQMDQGSIFSVLSPTKGHARSHWDAIW